MSKKAALHNLGCKVNAYETEAMQEMLEKAGYEIVPFKEGADVYVINTCTVTNIADRKSRQMLHRARKMNPDAVVVAAGCYVQAQEGKVDSCIDIVLGNNKKKDLIRILDEYRKSRAESGREKEILPDVELEDIGHTKEYESLNLTRPGDHTRAYIKVQDGCNQFCTYCIIPYARGRVRSRSMEDVTEEVRTLAENGYKEVVLTGIHLSSYGIDFDKERHLLDLIRAVHQIEGIERIRLGSLEPGIITEEFAEAISKLPKMCPHFHLSLQSGCNATLKRMNRHYTPDEYYDIVLRLRKAFPDCAITTDIMIGFAGETDEEFKESCEFAQKVGFAAMHVFTYSIREGTAAARRTDHVAHDIAVKRYHAMSSLAKKLKEEYFRSCVGKTEKVLIQRRESEEYANGLTPQYVPVRIYGSDANRQDIITVQITRASGSDFCVGEEIKCL